jgi:hypothetical protein
MSLGDAEMSMAPLLAATQNVSMFDAVSPPAEAIRNVGVLAVAVTGFIFVIVEGDTPLLPPPLPARPRWRSLTGEGRRHTVKSWTIRS